MEKMEKHREELKKKPDLPSAGAEEHYCPICGKEASDPTLKRFGEYFCSEAHVTEYARAVRGRAEEAARQPVQNVQKEDQVQPKKRGLSSLLKLGACCAAPILALVFLAPLLGSGAGGLASLGGNLLYFAALLACPLGMYFMMRGMMKQGHGDQNREADGRPAPKVLPPDGKGKTG
jgi:hypothetical protein